MHRIKKILLWGIPALVLWGFFFFILRSNTLNLGERFIFSFTYVTSILFSIFIIQKLLIKRMRIFKPSIQILLKTLFYGTAILIGYLPALIGEVLYKLSAEDIINEVVYGISKTISALFTLPVSTLQYGHFITPEMISVLTGIFILLLLTAIVAGGLSYVDTRWAQFNAESTLRESRLKILEMQMKPHFLFNSINSISSLIKTNPDQAQDLLIRLSDFLRFNFNLGDRAEVSLGSELEFTENYLLLNQARFGDKLTWRIDADAECRQVNIPGMVIQPMVENALKHGWQRYKTALHIVLKCIKQQGTLLIIVTDNGCGMQSGLHFKSNFPPVGHALHNIRERLRIRYGGDNLLVIESNQGRGTKITIKIPEKK